MAGEQKKIIVVDDNNSNLTACKKILKPFYEVYTVPSAEKMFELLGHIMPDMILLDVEMPDMNGYEAAGRLKNDNTYRQIPLIFLTGRIDPKSEMFGLNMGALDYIHKPFVSELLLRRIQLHLSLADYQKMPEAGKTQPAKDELLSRINREIRPPLNAIAIMLGDAAASGEPEKIKAKLNESYKAVKDLLASVDGLLAINN